ncbi:MAG: GNAT family N-acetyltransferase [Thermoanaerobaculia bacterium]|nr:GNAT family N-acetyltransferase [Thermoanaerobaculia bacterium]
MPLSYSIRAPITVQQFVDVLKRSSLAERRPTEDLECLRGMIENSSLLVSAWNGDLLVGVARSVTDFHYCCYLSDLAVDEAFQRQGIGRRLQEITQDQLGPRCKMILLAAPAAATYYPHLGYVKHPDCWILARDRHVSLDPRDGEGE